ncbi:synaptotagmin-3-like isoform X2 [Malania oleifera]|uniref:synaptotagmin-3-like isoform X2 n=1 Tax=Malania oleifera TaxID=397392 RepID=UPI0025ADEFED|nr:synaptotagmin-3-like isoform X2 [Malania oleifera]
MGFVSSLLGIIGFGLGIPFGLLFGFFFFMYCEPRNVKAPIIRPLRELDAISLLDLLPDIPLWVKNPDYDRVDWLNKFIFDMWPYLDKAVCGTIRSMAEPIFSEYIGKFHINSIDFESMSLGTLPPTVHGIKVQETNENELVIEPAVRWAGNPSITLVLKLLSLPITIQLMDLHIIAATRIVLKPLVPAFPCFASIMVSLMEKPHVDFGLKLMGADIMAIPGLYHFVQEQIRKQVASLYLWPQTLEIPILDASVGAIHRPVGILHVTVLCARKLLKMDLLGTSDPYVELSLSGERLPAKKTSIKMKNLNPEWNEHFNLIVKDPQAQILQLRVFDWEKVGTHDKLGMQVVPLKYLSPCETKKFTLDLLKITVYNDPQNKKPRGQIVVEMAYNPFREDNKGYIAPLDASASEANTVKRKSRDKSFHGAGLLLVNVQGAEDVEGKHQTNPYALIHFRGEQRKTQIIKKTRKPCWNEEFEFMLEGAPLKERIHIEVMSKRRSLGFRLKESLGHVDINLTDVVYNGRINEKYHLINSKNGVIRVEIRWKVI